MKQPLRSNSRAGCPLTSGLWYVLPDDVCGLMPRDCPCNTQHTVPGWWVYRPSFNSQLWRTSPPEGAFVCLPEARQVLRAKASTAGCPLPDCSLSVLPINMISAANILYGGCHHSRHWGITKALISLLAWPRRPSHPSVKEPFKKLSFNLPLIIDKSLGSSSIEPHQIHLKFRARDDFFLISKF